VVDVPATMMAVLVREREIRQAEAAVHGTEARWLFPSPTENMPLSDNAVRDAFYKTLTAASLPRVRVHALRHTYATLEIQAGTPLLTVSRQLGHSGISTTADTYGHDGPGSNRAAADAMEAILTDNPAQPDCLTLPNSSDFLTLRQCRDWPMYPPPRSVRVGRDESRNGETPR